MENEKHAITYNALAEVLGPENVSDDMAVNEAYTRDFLPPGLLDSMRPETVYRPKERSQSTPTHTR